MKNRMESHSIKYLVKKAKIETLRAFLLISLLFPVKCISQGITGKVIDGTSNEGIPYVNIGLLNKGIGTVSDSSGDYKLKSTDANLNDTLKFSAIGYLDLMMKFKDFIQKYGTHNTIRLKRNPLALDMVDIVSKKARHHTVGNTTSLKKSFMGFDNGELGSEIGVPMKARKNRLTRLLDANFKVEKSSYDKFIFRINVYTLKNGIPDSNIVKRPIYGSTTIKCGTITVDLRPYNIVVRDDFFVSIEWFRPDEVEGFICWSIGLFNTRGFKRAVSQGKWEKDFMGVEFYCHVETEKE